MAWCMHSYLLIAQSSGFYHLRGILKHIITFHNHGRVVRTNYQSSNCKGTWVTTVLPNISLSPSSPPTHSGVTVGSFQAPENQQGLPKLTRGSNLTTLPRHQSYLIFLDQCQPPRTKPTLWPSSEVSSQSSTLVCLPLCWCPTRASSVSSCHSFTSGQIRVLLYCPWPLHFAVLFLSPWTPPLLINGTTSHGEAHRRLCSDGTCASEPVNKNTPSILHTLKPVSFR